MKFTEHIEKIETSVKRKIGWILRTFRCRDTYFMKIIWKQLLQPHIDYCSQLFFRGQCANLEKLENLQKLYTKKISQFQNLNYWERLSALSLNSIERRLERYQIIYTWKVLEGKVPNCGINATINERLGRLCEIRKIAKTSSQKIQSLKEKKFYNKWAKTV